MRRVLPLLIAASTALAACGGDEETTPAACLEGPGAFANALREAPAQVRLPGGEPISGCLIENQSGGQLSRVGSALVTVATQLNAEARTDPAGERAVQLGYLVGAVQRGAEETGGIHAELVRRIEAAALFSPGGKPPPAFDRPYSNGYAEGKRDG